jgi:hypothetical protein
VVGRLPLSPFFFYWRHAREKLNIKKLVNAIFLEVFNRQKSEKQIAIFDFQRGSEIKEGS